MKYIELGVFTQVMIYRSLLLGLAEACTGGFVAEILALHRLDGKAQLSKEVSTVPAAMHRLVSVRWNKR